MASSPRSSLKAYAAKRRFNRTPEPAGHIATRQGHAFVVQKHAARRLHFDFRLELDGVLKSWAVAKGPSLDLAVRRLAVGVEDHPLDYGGFEGVIPAGEYGGGTVMLWDRGSWEPVGDAKKDYAAGRLKFILHGARMKGGWMLVRMKPRSPKESHENWLLIKERDDEARPGEADALIDAETESVASGQSMAGIRDAKDARVWRSNRSTPAASGGRATPPASLNRITGAKPGKLLDFVAPALARFVATPPDGADWLHEIKIDGYRVHCRRAGEDVRLLTRTGQDWTRRFGTIADAVRALPGREFALDGEIAVFDDDGRSNFGRLQEALSANRQERLALVAFDLLHLDGIDLGAAPLIQRKGVLETLLKGVADPARLRYSDHQEGHGAALLRHACELNLEGIVSKRAESPYRSGRGGDWLKAKCVARQEFVIGGFTEGKGARRGAIGALLLGWYDGDRLVYAGRVGTGFSDAAAHDLKAKLARIATSRPPFAAVPAAARRGARWVKPKRVCEVTYRAVTQGGQLRQASFQGLREDKPAKQVTFERARKPAPGRRKRDPPNEVAGVTISHPDRIVFPDAGVTKLALAQYYAAVSDAILPEIAGRPLSLLRCPEGIGGQCFFQKHFATGVKSLERVAIKEHRGVRDYVVVREIGDLIALIQEGVVEIHPWGARADDPETPDRLVFDLDPAPEIAFAAVIRAAFEVRDLLGKAGLTTFVKTTGGKGLHVVVPLARKLGWAPAKAFARGVAEALAAARPGAYTANPLKRARHGKIFIDYLRNDRGATAVAPYVVRARPGAPVAMPVAWEALTKRFQPNRFTLATVPRLLAARPADPWRGIGDLDQRLSLAMLKSLGVGD
ncbi:MAG: DNA ligase D [Stellaceae bacterium]